MSKTRGLREAALAELNFAKGQPGREWLMSRRGAGRELAALSDSQLMLEIEAGNVRAFAGLYDRYSARAYRVARSVCRDRGHAEDAVQNAFVSIWRSRGSYQEQRGTVSAWLLTTVHHRAVDIARNSGSHDSRLAPEDQLDTFLAPDDTYAQVVALDDSERMHALLGRLPHAQREVLTLAFYGGLSHAEIAQKLGVPAGTVKGRMRLALNKLRADLEPVTL